MKLLLLILLCIIQSIRIYGQQISFDRFLEQLNGIEDGGNYQKALEYLGSHEKCFQEQWFALSKEQIYLNEKLKRFEENLSVFKEGHQGGFFYFLHPAIPRSDREIKSIFKDIQLKYQVDTSIIVVAGMSAGSNNAIGMALRGVIPVSGILAFCPGLPHERSLDIKAYLLGGEHDFYLKQQAKLAEIFDQIGLDYLYVIEEGMSHQYPEDEEKYISEGLQFLLNQ